MKMNVRALAALLAIMAALGSGCAPAKTVTTAGTRPTQTTAAAMETEPEEEPTSPTTAQTTAAEPVYGPSILDGREQLDEAGIFWEIECERITQLSQQTLMSFAGDFLLMGTRVEDGAVAHVLALISGEDGSLLAETEMNDLTVAEAQICGDGIAVTDLVTGTVVFLDGELKETGRMSTGTEGANLYVSPQGDAVYAFLAQEGLTRIDMETGERRVVAEGADLFPGTRNGSAVTFTYVDRTTQRNMHGCLDLVSGEVTSLDFGGGFFTAEANDQGLWLAGKMNEEGVYYLGVNEPRIFTSPAENAIVTLLGEPARVLLRCYNDDGTNTLSLYGVDGSFLSGGVLPLKNTYVIQEPLWLEGEGGYLFPVSREDGGDRLIFWDLSAPAQGKNVNLKAVENGEKPAGTAVSPELYERAEALGQKHGVSILIADQCGGDYGDHAAQAECDEDMVSQGLDMVERALLAYPEGFMEQLICADLQRLEIHLTGAIRRTDQAEDAEGFTGFVGFAQTEGTLARVAVDIAQPGSAEHTLHHEIMHIIDHKLSFDAGIREGALYSEESWNALNPEGFVYAESLTELPEDFYSGGLEAWFVDDYSRTYGKEDRARIMEYAMMEEDFIFAGSPGRRQKLEWLCRVIRDAFDTTGWPEDTIWEGTLSRSGK